MQQAGGGAQADSGCDGGGDASVPLAHPLERLAWTLSPGAPQGRTHSSSCTSEGARDTSAATVDVFGHGRAATEEEIISQLRGAMIDDLNVKFEGALPHDLPRLCRSATTLVFLVQPLPFRSPTVAVLFLEAQP